MRGLFVVACDIMCLIGLDLHNIVLIRLQNNGLYLPLQQHFLTPVLLHNNIYTMQCFQISIRENFKQAYSILLPQRHFSNSD